MTKNQEIRRLMLTAVNNVFLKHSPIISQVPAFESGVGEFQGNLITIDDVILIQEGRTKGALKTNTRKKKK